MATAIEMEVLPNKRTSYSVIESSFVALNEAHLCYSVTMGVKVRDNGGSNRDHFVEVS